MTSYKLYYIEWCDAMQHIGAWTTEQEGIEWMQSNEGLCQQVGWIVKETKDYLLLCSRIGHINEGENSLGGLFKIPTKWVKKRVNLTSSF